MSAFVASNKIKPTRKTTVNNTSEIITTFKWICEVGNDIVFIGFHRNYTSCFDSKLKYLFTFPFYPLAAVVTLMCNVKLVCIEIRFKFSDYVIF